MASRTVWSRVARVAGLVLTAPAQMSTCLDYCSELLSLVAKTAALYAERSTDSAVLATISDIENLTNGMSRKIWQKLAMLAGGDARSTMIGESD